MHQPVPHGMQVPDFMAFKPVKGNLPGGVMIRQVQCLGDKLNSRLIIGMKQAATHPDSGQFTF